MDVFVLKINGHYMCSVTFSQHWNLFVWICIVVVDSFSLLCNILRWDYTTVGVRFVGKHLGCFQIFSGMLLCMF